MHVQCSVGITKTSMIVPDFPHLPGINYHKVVSSNTSHFEAHADFFRFLMKGIFDPYVTFRQEVDFLIT